MLGTRKGTHRLMEVDIGDDCLIFVRYPVDDPIWYLDEEKRHRKAVADVQRKLMTWADEQAAIPVTVRG